MHDSSERNEPRPQELNLPVGLSCGAVHGESLTYTASGLPLGLGLHADTGISSGLAVFGPDEDTPDHPLILPRPPDQTPPAA
jgi:hypothetical protein